MELFARDQEELITRIKSVAGAENVAVNFFTDSPMRGAGPGPRRTWRAYHSPGAGCRILVVSDFGIGGPAFHVRRSRLAEWQDFMIQVSRGGCLAVGLIPYPPDRWPGWLCADAAARLGSRHHCRQDGHVRGGTVGFMPAHSQRPQPGPSTPIEDLATALSVAVRIEPELIRAVRLGVFPNYGVAVEADLWFSDLVRSRGSHGIVFDEDVRHRLQGRLSKLLSRTSPSDPIHRVGAIIARIHDHLSPALLIEEKATWHAIRGEMSAVEEALRPALRAVALERRQGVVQWFTAARNRLPDSARTSVTAWKIAQVSQQQAVREKEDLPGIGSASLKTEDLADIVDMLDDTRLLVCRVGPSCGSVTWTPPMA